MVVSEGTNSQKCAVNVEAAWIKTIRYEQGVPIYEADEWAGMCCGAGSVFVDGYGNGVCDQARWWKQPAASW